MMLGPRKSRPHAFTLVELLVVISIIGLLIGLILPSLGRARSLSRLSACSSNLRQVAIAVQQYAMDNQHQIPVGPDLPMAYNPARNWNEWASNQLWVGSGPFANGLGLLIDSTLTDPLVLFCPGDDSAAEVMEELSKARHRGDRDAYGSYLYRQYQQTSRGSFDDLGANELGLPANALALDVNSLGYEKRTNHNSLKVNIVYRDSHVQTASNAQHVFSLRQEDFFGFPNSTERRLDQILINADYAENGNPEEAPILPAPFCEPDEGT
jgi:prepilin-type N-terminal cleavage/methylation domain-containing protein